MSRTLVLNATYEPLGVVTDRRALILVLNHRATMVEDSGDVLRFSGGQIALPSVVRLNKFVRIPYRHAVPLSPACCRPEYDKRAGVNSQSAPLI